MFNQYELLFNPYKNQFFTVSVVLVKYLLVMSYIILISVYPNLYLSDF